MSIYKFIEQSQERMESIEVPNTGRLLSDYAYGRCQIFAYALSLELGYEMEFMWDMDYYFEGGDTESMVLAHAYCVLPNQKDTFVDARGVICKDVILYDYEYNRERFERISGEQLQQYFAEEFLEKPSEGELAALRQYIRNNVADYN